MTSVEELFGKYQSFDEFNEQMYEDEITRKNFRFRRMIESGWLTIDEVYEIIDKDPDMGWRGISELDKEFDHEDNYKLKDTHVWVNWFDGGVNRILMKKEDGCLTNPKYNYDKLGVISKMIEYGIITPNEARVSLRIDTNGSFPQEYYCSGYTFGDRPINGIWNPYGEPFTGIEYTDGKYYEYRVSTSGTTDDSPQVVDITTTDNTHPWDNKQVVCEYKDPEPYKNPYVVITPQGKTKLIRPNEKEEVEIRKCKLCEKPLEGRICTNCGFDNEKSLPEKNDLSITSPKNHPQQNKNDSLKILLPVFGIPIIFYVCMVIIYISMIV